MNMKRNIQHIAYERDETIWLIIKRLLFVRLSTDDDDDDDDDAETETNL